MLWNEPPTITAKINCESFFFCFCFCLFVGFVCLFVFVYFVFVLFLLLYYLSLFDMASYYTFGILKPWLLHIRDTLRDLQSIGSARCLIRCKEPPHPTTEKFSLIYIRRGQWKEWTYDTDTIWKNKNSRQKGKPKARFSCYSTTINGSKSNICSCTITHHVQQERRKEHVWCRHRRKLQLTNIYIFETGYKIFLSYANLTLMIIKQNNRHYENSNLRT